MTIKRIFLHKASQLAVFSIFLTTHGLIPDAHAGFCKGMFCCFGTERAEKRALLKRERDLKKQKQSSHSGDGKKTPVQKEQWFEILLTRANTPENG